MDETIVHWYQRRMEKEVRVEFQVEKPLENLLVRVDIPKGKRGTKVSEYQPSLNRNKKHGTETPRRREEDD